MLDRRFLLPFVGAFLAVMVGAEITVRLTTDDFPPPPTWGNRLITAQSERMLDRGPVEVAFIGSSVMEAAVDPAVLVATSSTVTSAHNASLAGTSPAFHAVYAAEVTLPALCPGVVVLGVSPRDLTGAGDAEVAWLRQYVESRGRRELLGTEHTLDEIEIAAEDALALVDERANLREPARALSQLLGDPVEDWNAVAYTAEGYFTGFEDVEPDLTVRPGRYEDLTVDDEELEAIRAVATAVEATGAEFVLLDLPYRSDLLVEAVPGGTATFAAYHDAMADLADELGVGYVDGSDWLTGSDDFADPIHTRRSGTERTSERLAEALDDLDPTLAPTCSG